MNSPAFANAVERGAFDGMHGHVTLELPYPLSVNNLFRNDGKRRVKTEDYRAWRVQAGVMIMQQRRRMVDGPVSIIIEVRAPDKRLRDGDNITKCVFDALVTNGVIHDDNNRIIREHLVRWVDSGPPCRVTIIPVE